MVKYQTSFVNEDTRQLLQESRVDRRLVQGVDEVEINTIRINVFGARPEEDPTWFLDPETEDRLVEALALALLQADL